MSESEPEEMEAETATEAPDEITEDEEELTRDDMFHVLQCRRRRLVLKYLAEYTGEDRVVMSDITEHIAALENDTTVRGLHSQQRQRVYIALYQSHLPKLDTMGIIDYNKSRGYVEPTELTAAFRPFLDAEPSVLYSGEGEPGADPTVTGDRERSEWVRRYAIAAGASTTGVATMGLAGGAIAVPSLLAVTLVLSVVFTLLAVVHWALPAE